MFLQPEVDTAFFESPVRPPPRGLATPARLAVGRTTVDHLGIAIATIGQLRTSIGRRSSRSRSGRLPHADDSHATGLAATLRLAGLPFIMAPRRADGFDRIDSTPRGNSAFCLEAIPSLVDRPQARPPQIPVLSPTHPATSAARPNDVATLCGGGAAWALRHLHDIAGLRRSRVSSGRRSGSSPLVGGLVVIALHKSTG